MFEGMTQEEYDFFERIKKSNPEQAAHFREMLGVLMSGYGDPAPGMLVVVHVNKNMEVLDTYTINADPVNALSMLVAAAHSIQESLSAQERDEFALHMALHAADNASKGPLQ